MVVGRLSDAVPIRSAVLPPARSEMLMRKKRKKRSRAGAIFERVDGDGGGTVDCHLIENAVRGMGGTIGQAEAVEFVELGNPGML